MYKDRKYDPDVGNNLPCSFLTEEPTVNRHVPLMNPTRNFIHNSPLFPQTLTPEMTNILLGIHHTSNEYVTLIFTSEL